MKTLTQHIQESLNKSIKEVSSERPVEEDMSDIMRTNPAKGSVITRGTTKIEDDKKN